MKSDLLNNYRALTIRLPASAAVSTARLEQGHSFSFIDLFRVSTHTRIIQARQDDVS